MRRHRDQAAVIAPVAPGLPPQGRLRLLLREMGDRDDLLRRGEQQQQLVGAQVQRRHPPRRGVRPAERPSEANRQK